LSTLDFLLSTLDFLLSTLDFLLSTLDFLLTTLNFYSRLSTITLDSRLFLSIYTLDSRPSTFRYFSIFDLLYKYPKKLYILRGCLCKNRAPSSGRKFAESLQIFHNNFPFRYLYEKRNRFALKSFFCKILPIDILHLDGSKMAA
jgi:hypothetical protein